MALASVTLAVALASAGAAPAQGQSALVGPIDVGVQESSTILGCPDFNGQSRPVQGAVARVFIEAKRQKVGEVFYADAGVGAVDQCVRQSARVEVIPPVGVELAISAATPVRCFYSDGQGPPETIGPEQGCPQQPAPGAYGGLALNRTSGPGAPLWQLTGKEPLRLELPLRASRPLSGPVSLNCGRRVNVDPPCRPEQAGDSLQVGFFVISSRDTWLVPNVGLFADPAPAAPVAATGAPVAAPSGLSLSAPRALRIRRALRGIQVTVQVPRDGAVRAELRAAVRLRGVRRGLIARVTRRARAGRVQLRLKPSRAAARALRRKRLVVATLRVTLTAAGTAAQTAATQITLRR